MSRLPVHDQTDSAPPPSTVELLDDMSGIVSPPDVYVRVTELLQDSAASADAIADVIALDPHLTARLLRLVNSVYFGFARRIDTVSRAIAVLGETDLVSLVLAVSAVRSLSKLPTDRLDLESFWRHSIHCALGARAIARRAGVLHPERLFVAGLLHDVGYLVLFNRLPDLMREIATHAGADEELMVGLEQATLGFDHAAVAGDLLARWHLPETTCAAVRLHHQDVGDGESLEAAIVRLADRMATQSCVGALQRRALQLAEDVAVEEDPLIESIHVAIGGNVDLEAVREETAEGFTAAVGALLGAG
ncbi:MAG: HDOD domain-containing protein [Ectothiorhodospiraceae bacterium]|nr:HDOD domain-containing protein [Chromatiales bacterium]MCP5157407.1 HDOD domain-containing protein [Ectothiorhodospiraceae bacterium]